MLTGGVGRDRNRSEEAEAVKSKIGHGYIAYVHSFVDISRSAAEFCSTYGQQVRQLMTVQPSTQNQKKKKASEQIARPCAKYVREKADGR